MKESSLIISEDLNPMMGLSETHRKDKVKVWEMWS